MTSLNKVFVAGNLTRDPEVRYTPRGTAVATLRLAIDDSYRNRETGETIEKACFVDVQAWGRQAETCGQYLAKGSPVLVEGGLELDQWENQQGEKRSKLRVKAFRVQFLGSPRRSAHDGVAGAPDDAAKGQESDGNDSRQDGDFPQPDAGPPDDADDPDDLPF